MKKQTITMITLGFFMMVLILGAAFMGAKYVSDKEEVSTEESGDSIESFGKEINSYFNQIGVTEDLEIGEIYELETEGYDNTEIWSACTLKYQIVDCQILEYDELYNEVQLGVAIYIPFEYEENGLNCSWNLGMVDRYSGLEIPADGTHIKLEDGSVIYGSTTSESSYDSENYIYYYIYDMMVPADYDGMDFFVAPWTRKDDATSDELADIGELVIDDYTSFSKANFKFYRIAFDDINDGTI